MDMHRNAIGGFRTAGARLALVALTLACAAASPAALAHGGRGHGGGHVHFGVGLYFGAPVFGYPYYYPHYYYPPAVYSPPVVYSSPPVYVEQSEPVQAPPQAQPAQAWWYYCAAPGAYYPYVKECPGGWQRVAPTPPH